MDELNFRFVYNGKNSFLNLLDNVRKNTKADRSGRYWSGLVKVKDKKYFTVKQKYFTFVLFKIIWNLKDEENVLVEIYLHSP